MQNQVTENELEQFVEHGTLNILGYELTGEEVNLSYVCRGVQTAGEQMEAHSDGQVFMKLHYYLFIFVYVYLTSKSQYSGGAYVLHDL